MSSAKQIVAPSATELIARSLVLLRPRYLTDQVTCRVTPGLGNLHVELLFKRRDHDEHPDHASIDKPRLFPSKMTTQRGQLEIEVNF